MKLLETVLESMFSRSKAQNFFCILLIGLISLRGSWILGVNQLGIIEVIAQLGVCAALDCSFVNKSGDKTCGLGRFFDSRQGNKQGKIN
jgi:hypothetical protein